MPTWSRYYSLGRQVRQRRFPARDIGRVSLGAANLVLGVRKNEIFDACEAEGILHMDERKTLAHDKVMEFARESINSAEIAVRGARDGRTVGSWLRVHGVLPLVEVPRCGAIYRRDNVETFLPD